MNLAGLVRQCRSDVFLSIIRVQGLFQGRQPLLRFLCRARLSMWLIPVRLPADPLSKSLDDRYQDPLLGISWARRGPVDDAPRVAVPSISSLLGELLFHAWMHSIQHTIDPPTYIFATTVVRSIAGIPVEQPDVHVIGATFRKFGEVDLEVELIVSFLSLSKCVCINSS
jgi:hypothetical protein